MTNKVQITIELDIETGEIYLVKPYTRKAEKLIQKIIHAGIKAVKKGK